MFVLTLVLATIGASWMLTRQQVQSVSAIHPEDRTAIQKQSTPPNAEPSRFLPAEDVPGKDIPDLSRYPGSVRVEYEREEQDLLRITRVRYLSHARVDVIRAFYRGIFRAEGWKVANLEYSEGEWTFLVVHGEREAEVRIEAHRRGVTMMVIELSEPHPQKEPAPKETPQKREASPAAEEPASLPPPQSAARTPAVAPAAATPARAPHPAPAPGDYEKGGDDRDDVGDDGGGDD